MKPERVNKWPSPVTAGGDVFKAMVSIVVNKQYI
jgi:hypothetical protein